ncbi:hypothetical protein KKG05_01495, partial [bacterium]|nr:hypothetical protein [bacterium]
VMRVRPAPMTAMDFGSKMDLILARLISFVGAGLVVFFSFKFFVLFAIFIDFSNTQERVG